MASSDVPTSSKHQSAVPSDGSEIYYVEAKSTSDKCLSAVPSVDPFGTSTLGKHHDAYNELSAESDTELLLYLSELIKIHAKALAIAESKFVSGGSGPKIYTKAIDFKRSLDAGIKLLNEFVISKKKLKDQLTILRHAEVVKLVLDDDVNDNSSIEVRTSNTDVSVGDHIEVVGGTSWCKPPSGGALVNLQPCLIEYAVIKIIARGVSPIATLKSIDKSFSGKTIQELQNHIDRLKKSYDSIETNHRKNPNPPADLRESLAHAKLLVDGEIAMITKLIDAKRTIEDYETHGVGYDGGAVMKLRDLAKRG
jgi:hypothetical protein